MFELQAELDKLASVTPKQQNNDNEKQGQLGVKKNVKKSILLR